jgi:acyl-CoA thioesterase
MELRSDVQQLGSRFFTYTTMTQRFDKQEAMAILEGLPPQIQELALKNLQTLVDRDPSTGPFGWMLGIHYTDRASGKASCQIKVDNRLYNPGQIAHGGVVFTLADSAMGAAVFTLLDPGQRCATAELKINYLAPVRTGTVSATATVVSKRKRLAVVTCEVHDQAGELVALAQGTFAVVEKAPGQPAAGDI